MKKRKYVTNVLFVYLIDEVTGEIIIKEVA